MNQIHSPPPNFGVTSELDKKIYIEYILCDQYITLSCRILEFRYINNEIDYLSFNDMCYTVLFFFLNIKNNNTANRMTPTILYFMMCTISTFPIIAKMI